MITGNQYYLSLGDVLEEALLLRVLLAANVDVVVANLIENTDEILRSQSNPTPTKR